MSEIEQDATSARDPEASPALLSPGRLEAFSDGVIAIAITLLSLEIRLPEDSADLSRRLASLWPNYIGFVISFLLIGQVWLNHHALVSRLRRVDHLVLVCNLLLLLDVAFLPFATTVLTDSLTSGEDTGVAAAFYGGTMVVGGLFFNALWWAARREPRNLVRDVSPPQVRSMTRRFLLGPILYAVAAALGLVSIWLSLGAYIALIVFYMASSLPTRRAKAYGAASE